MAVRGGVMTERRRCLAKGGGAMAAATMATTVGVPNVIAQPKVQWRMSTAWSPANDILQGAALRLAKVVDEMSGGRFRIEVFPGGQIIPPLEWFQAAPRGPHQAYRGVSAY